MAPPPRLCTVVVTTCMCFLAAVAGIPEAPAVGGQAAALAVQLTVNLTLPPVTVRREFLSTTIDVSLLVNNGQHCDLSSPRLRTMARELAPVWLRVGGTEADTFWYDMGTQAGKAPPNPGYSRVFNASTWDAVCSFASDVGMQIAFGINAGPGPRGALKGEGPWTASNALTLMNYSASIGCPVVGFEFGNEPNLFYKFNISVKPETYAKDMATFVSAVKSINASLLTIAPDVDFIPIVGDFFYLEQLLPKAQGHATWDVVSFHFYPTFAPEHYSDKNLPSFLQPLISRPGLLLDPEVLNMVGGVARTVRAATNKYQSTSTEVWLGETGSAVGGGAANVSDAFVDGIEWLDKLGQMGTEGVDLVFRQTLCGYRYGFIDFELQPRPDYFTSVLFKRLVGTKSWNVTKGAKSDDMLRAYMFCGTQPSTMVAVLVNLHNTSTIDVHFTNRFGGPRHDYILTAPGAVLTSSVIQLNGVALNVTSNGTLPAMPPVVVTNTSLPVTMPPRSYGFAAWTAANVAECQ